MMEKNTYDAIVIGSGISGGWATKELIQKGLKTILPTTATPGAKAARVGSFMAVMVRDCYSPADQKIFLNSLTQLDEA